MSKMRNFWKTDVVLSADSSSSQIMTSRRTVSPTVWLPGRL